MEALVKLDVDDTVMEIYFPCPLCQQNYLSPERVQEHIPNCSMLSSSSLLVPHIESYSSSNPQALDLNVDSQEFPEAGQTDCQADETTESNLRNLGEIYQNAASQDELEPLKTGPKDQILGNSMQNPDSTFKEDQDQHEDCQKWELKYSCDTCGERFALGTSLIDHRKIHQRAAVFKCVFPGCAKTFKSRAVRRSHLKTHASGAWNGCAWRPRILRKNQSLKSIPGLLIPRSEHLLPDNQGLGGYPDTEYRTGEFSVTDQNDKSSKNIRTTSSTDDMKSKNPAQVVSCCYPGCYRNFSSMSDIWIHQKFHPACLWNGTEEKAGIVGQNQASEDSPSTNMPVTDNGGTKSNRVGQVFTGRRLEPSQSPQKNQINNSSKSDQNIPREPETGAQSPGELVVFTCGICDDSFENSDALKSHVLTTHAGPEESQAEESEETGTPVDNSFGCVQSNCEGDPVPAEVEENEATSNLPENSYGRIQQEGRAPRYPIVKIGDKKYLYCGFPDCGAVFGNRNSRYVHHKKFHTDAYRHLLTNLAAGSMQLQENSGKEKKANETLSTQLNENPDKEQKNVDMGGPPNFPSIQVNGKEYFWCDIPDCGIVVTTLQARYLHQKKHQMSSEQPRVAENSVGTDSVKPKVAEEGRKHFQVKPAGVAERKGDEILDHALPPNQPEVPEFSIQDDEETSAQSPMPGLPTFLDGGFEAEEEEMADLHDQNIETLQCTVSYHSPMELSPLINGDSRAENIFQTDNGGLGSSLRTEASTSNLNPVHPNMSNQTSKAETVKDQKSRGNGRRPVDSTIQIGTKTLFCCDFPGCKGVFNSRGVRYLHLRRHRRGFEYVNSWLKLTEDGKVWDSVGGCFITE